MSTSVTALLGALRIRRTIFVFLSCLVILLSSGYGLAASRKAYVDYNGGTQLVQEAHGWRVITVLISSRPGILKTGDLVVKIGDRATAGLSPISVFYLLRNSWNKNLPIIVRRDSHETELHWPAEGRTKPWISNAEFLKRYGIGAAIVKRKEPQGVFIDGVAPKGPAARAGLRAGDQILAVDGHTVRGLSVLQVVRLLLSKSPGKVRLSIRRGDHELEIEVQRALMSQVLSPPRPPTLLIRGALGRRRQQSRSESLPYSGRADIHACGSRWLRRLRRDRHRSGYVARGATAPHHQGQRQLKTAACRRRARRLSIGGHLFAKAQTVAE